jgi:hypothetical protein
MGVSGRRNYQQFSSQQNSCYFGERPLSFRALYESYS